MKETLRIIVVAILAVILIAADSYCRYMESKNEHTGPQ